MDQQVLRAMRRWPDVPDCAGWLALDARGQWWVREAQALPWPRNPDASLQRAGASRLEHSGLCDFIARNYQPDADGYWFFQNGPQRVLVELDAAPLVLRLDVESSSTRCVAHTGVALTPRSAWLDELGRVWLATDAGAGLVHSLDVARLEPWVDEPGQALHLPGLPRLALQPLALREIESRLGFRVSPSASPRWR